MMLTTKRLIDIANQDIQALSRFKITLVHQQMDEKKALTEKLASYIRLIKQNPDLLKSVPKEALASAKEDAAFLDTKIAHNKRKLQTTEAAFINFMQIIKKVVTEKTQPINRYTKHGHYNHGKGSEQRIPAVNINQTF